MEPTAENRSVPFISRPVCVLRVQHDLDIIPVAGVQPLKPCVAVFQRSGRADNLIQSDRSARDHVQAGGILAGGRAGAAQRQLAGNDPLHGEVYDRRNISDEDNRPAFPR